MAGVAAAQGVVRALRQDIARIEGRLAETLGAPDGTADGTTGGTTGIVTLRRSPPVAAPALLETGSARLDAALGGGLPRAGLVEILSRETRDAGASAGFALGLLARLAEARPKAPLLWIGTSEIMREAGLPYAPGMRSLFGIEPSALLLAPVAQLADALWVAEEAAGVPALAAIVLELRGNPGRLDLVATRRLHMRARTAGRPLLLLRQGAVPLPGAAPVRLAVSPAPAGMRHTLAAPLPRSIGPPGLVVSIDRSRASRPVSATLEWNRHERRFLDRDDARPDRTRFPGAPRAGALAALSGDRTDPAPALWPDMARAAGAGR